MSNDGNIVKIQHTLPFKKYLEILFYKNSHAKFGISMDFSPCGVAGHRGLFFSMDIIGFTFFFSLFGGLLPYWVVDQKKDNKSTTEEIKTSTEIQSPTQTQLDKERAEGEGMGNGRHKFWEQN